MKTTLIKWKESKSDNRKHENDTFQNKGARIDSLQNSPK